MPKIYRGMKQDQGKPAIGPTGTTLGVRMPGDIETDANGLVHPGTGGMSVAPSLQTLPYFRIPRRLQNIRPDASGTNELFVWSMGTGDFTDGAVADVLGLRLDPLDDKHGFVEPAVSMSFGDYQTALTETQDIWTIDEK